MVVVVVQTSQSEHFHFTMYEGRGSIKAHSVPKFLNLSTKSRSVIIQHPLPEGLLAYSKIDPSRVEMVHDIKRKSNPVIIINSSQLPGFHLAKVAYATIWSRKDRKNREANQ